MSSSLEDEIQCSSGISGYFVCMCTVKNFDTRRGSQHPPYKTKSFHRSDSTEWFMTISGRQYSHVQYLTFTLVCSSSEKKSVQASFSVSLRNTAGKIIKEWSSCEWVDSSSANAWKETIKRSDVLNRLKDKCLVISCQVNYVLSTVLSGERVQFGESLPSSFRKLSTDLYTFYQDKKMTDVIVNVENTEIKVHSIVLAARSKVFAAMFQNNCIENRVHRIEIPDFSSKTVASMFEFLYQGVVFVDFSEALELLKAADKYDLGDLRSYCSHFLICHLSKYNVVEALVWADIYSISTLKTKALMFLQENRKLLSIKEYKALLEPRPNLLLDIIDYSFAKL